LALFNPEKDLRQCSLCLKNDIVLIETPYAFKLLVQELESMGIQMRLNTDPVDIPLEQIELDRFENEEDIELFESEDKTERTWEETYDDEYYMTGGHDDDKGNSEYGNGEESVTGGEGDSEDDSVTGGEGDSEDDSVAGGERDIESVGESDSESGGESDEDDNHIGGDDSELLYGGDNGGDNQNVHDDSQSQELSRGGYDNNESQSNEVSETKIINVNM